MALDDEHTAPGALAAKLLERTDRPGRFADHDRLGPLGQHGLNRPLDLRIRLDQLADETPNAELRHRLRPGLQQMARPGADVLPPLDHFPE